MFETKTLSSLAKVFPTVIRDDEIKSAVFMKNEPFSFQVAFKGTNSKDRRMPVYIRIESDIDSSLISQYLVENVSVLNGEQDWPYKPDKDEGYESKDPGLYPDILRKRITNGPVKNDGFWSPRIYECGEKNMLMSYERSWQSIWFTVNESGASIPSGNKYIDIVFYGSEYSGDKPTEIKREHIDLTVIDKDLPKQSLIYTSWFHCDCLADLYGVPIFSDRFFDIFRSFAAAGTETGMNMIMLPAFTPPLDTPENMERMTAQLVGVTLKDGNFSFDFSLMEKYITIAKECGVEYFEHNHMFTQWGAKHAPKIVVNINGNDVKYFGWQTDSKGEEYKKFLNQYFTALLPFLDKMGLKGKVLFHISDEPNEEHLDYYKNAAEIVSKYIDGYMCGDALSHYEFYENGSVKMPIVANNSPEMDKFIKGCDNFWAYYCGECLHDGTSARLLNTTGARNRVLGLQLYCTGAKGFLNWGYNYYYGALSHGLTDPISNPHYEGLAGTSFVVYPGFDGTAVLSSRMKVFYEGLNDHRVLTLAESLYGKDKVMSVINKHFGNVDYYTCPTNSQYLAFRDDINKLFIEG